MNYISKTMCVFLVSVILVMSLPLTVQASNEEPTVDVIFIMDLSGSMNSADPNKISLLSVSIFADFLAESSSQIGYVLFSNDVHLNNMLALTPISQARSQISNNLGRVVFEGSTNIPAGLDKALNLFSQSNSGNQKVAILFTDGDVYMPTSSGLTNQQGEDRCRELARAFKDAGIPLYTVGLNHNNSILKEDFIKELSVIASPPGKAAMSRVARNASELPQIFSEIYINIFNGNADVDLVFDSVEKAQTATFFAEERIYELNVLLMHNSKLDNLTIRQPGGERYQGASFQERTGYSFVKIRNPDVGDWEFTFEGAIVSANKLVRYGTIGGPDLTITFHTDGGGELESIKVPYGRTLQNIPTPIKEGYRFEGWYLNEARTQAFSINQTFARDTQLYARWIQPPVRKVTFTGEGVDNKEHIVPAGERAITYLPETPMRRGYTFNGWALSDGSLLDHNTIIAQDAVFTASWDVIVFNWIPSACLGVFTFIVLIGGILGGKKAFGDSQKKSKYFSTVFSVLFTIVFTFACWSLLTAYIVPYELHYTSNIAHFVLYGALIIPILTNSLLSGILPHVFVNPASTFPKDKQYRIHLLLTLIGLLWPIIIWFQSGFELSVFWLLGYAIVTYPVGFILSALILQQGQTHELFFIKV